VKITFCKIREKQNPAGLTQVMLYFSTNVTMPHAPCHMPHAK
jgi:hypothetical protein